MPPYEPPAPAPVPQQPSHRSLIVAILVIILVAALGTAYYFYQAQLSDAQKLQQLQSLPNNPTADTLTDTQKQNLLNGKPAGG